MQFNNGVNFRVVRWDTTETRRTWRQVSLAPVSCVRVGGTHWDATSRTEIFTAPANPDLRESGVKIEASRFGFNCLTSDCLNVNNLLQRWSPWHSTHFGCGTARTQRSTSPALSPPTASGSSWCGWGQSRMRATALTSRPSPERIPSTRPWAGSSAKFWIRVTSCGPPFMLPRVRRLQNNMLLNRIR